MITAKGETIDKVLGLELGADDYIIKPFDVAELQARVEGVLRRYHKGSGKVTLAAPTAGNEQMWALVGDAP